LATLAQQPSVLAIMKLMNKESLKILLTIGICALLGGILALYMNQAITIKSSSRISVLKTKPESEAVTMMFVGDMMLDRYIRAQAESNKYTSIISAVKRQMKEVDIVIGNLEGTITSQQSVSTYDPEDPNHYRFTFAPLVADLLKDHNVGLVSIGNNHITDFGSTGVSETTDYLESAGISYAGHPYDNKKISSNITINEQVFAFTSFNYADKRTSEITVEEIINLKNQTPTPDWIIILTHWGNEYQEESSSTQRQQARSFIDAGADLIIGSHPHVIQESETYNEGLIYYSLGNFIFDQYFSAAVSCGLVLQVEFNTNGTLQTSERTVKLINDGTTQFADCR